MFSIKGKKKDDKPDKERVSTKKRKEEKGCTG